MTVSIQRTTVRTARGLDTNGAPCTGTSRDKPCSVSRYNRINEGYKMRGYFEIGIYHTKTASNVGTLWRSAYQLGAAGIFTIGSRYPRQVTDTVKAERHIPMREYLEFGELIKNRPKGARIVAIEIGGKPLSETCHPEQAIYVLGAEDHGIPDRILKQCDMIVSIESLRTESYNVAVAGSLVMYHRFISRAKAPHRMKGYRP